MIYDIVTIIIFLIICCFLWTLIWNYYASNNNSKREIGGDNLYDFQAANTSSLEDYLKNTDANKFKEGLIKEINISGLTDNGYTTIFNALNIANGINVYKGRKIK
jgi:hypothetical protein